MRLLSNHSSPPTRLLDTVKEMAIYAMGDYIEARARVTEPPTPILPPAQLDHLLSAVFAGLKSTNSYLRQTASNVAGVLGAEKRVVAERCCPRIMNALPEAIEAANAEARRSEEVAAKEAAVASLVRILKARADVNAATASQVSPTPSHSGCY